MEKEYTVAGKPKKLRHLLRKPWLHQYWKDDGTLFQDPLSQTHRKPTWNEIFYDLIYVAVFREFGIQLEEHATGTQFLKFCILYTAIWSTWVETTTYINKFDTNDFFHKVFFFASMAGVIGMGLNSADAFENGGLGLLLSFITTRIALTIMYIRAAFFIKRARIYCGIHLLGFFVSSLFFLLGTVIPGFAVRITLWGVGSLSEYIIRTIFLLYEAWIWKPKHKTRINIPEHLEHISERLGLLVIIVLGDVVLSLLTTVKAVFPQEYRIYIISILALTIAFSLEYVYFDVEGERIYKHAVLRNDVTNVAWFFSHWPLTASIIVGSAGVAKMLITEQHADYASQWFFCGGFGTAIIGLAFIGTVHHSLHGTKLRWEIRSGFRYVIGLVVILLPLTGLSDLEVVITVASFSVFVIILEEIGTLPAKHDHWWNQKKKANKRMSAAMTQVPKQRLQEQ